MRLGAVLLIKPPCRVVEPSKNTYRGAGAIVLFAKQGGATGPYISSILPLAKQPRHPRTSPFVPAEF